MLDKYRVSETIWFRLCPVPRIVKFIEMEITSYQGLEDRIGEISVS